MFNSTYPLNVQIATRIRFQFDFNLFNMESREMFEKTEVPSKQTEVSMHSRSLLSLKFRAPGCKYSPTLRRSYYCLSAEHREVGSRRTESIEIYIIGLNEFQYSSKKLSKTLPNESWLPEQTSLTNPMNFRWFVLSPSGSLKSNCVGHVAETGRNGFTGHYCSRYAIL